VRFTLLFTASVLAASIGLSACSSGGSQSIPGGSQQTAPMAKSGGPHIIAVGAKPDASCPSQFITCVTIKKGSPATVEICVQYTTGYCPYPGVWTWTGQVVKVSTGAPFGKIKQSASPNPGNPTYITITEKKRVKKSHGKYKYEDNIETCNSASSCLSGSIGIATS
jgi:hypothetical protein